MENLNCFFKIHYPDGNVVLTTAPVPIVVDLVDMTPKLETILSQKLCAEIV